MMMIIIYMRIHHKKYHFKAWCCFHFPYTKNSNYIDIIYEQRSNETWFLVSYCVYHSYYCIWLFCAFSVAFYLNPVGNNGCWCWESDILLYFFFWLGTFALLYKCIYAWKRINFYGIYMRTTETTMCGKASSNLCLEQFSRRNIFVVFISQILDFYMRFFGMFLFCNKNMNEIHEKSGLECC